MKTTGTLCITPLLLAVFQLTLKAQTGVETRAEAQVNAWSTLNFSDPVSSQLGTRFIPGLQFSKKGKQLEFDAQVSFNTTGTLKYEKGKNTGSHEKFTPYRGWLRMSGKNYELRLGLQKINFGSAMLLRPLMWFDRIDPRDPLQITEGVYALLGRYYFKNNANVWLWGLYGNKATKGWESFSTANREPEFGGRVQFPLPGGEAAMSFHTRRVDFSSFYPAGVIRYNELFRQHKYGMDGKWDLGVGLCVEYVLKVNDYQRPSYPYKSYRQPVSYQQTHVSEGFRTSAFYQQAYVDESYLLAVSYPKVNAVEDYRPAASYPKVNAVEDYRPAASYPKVNAVEDYRPAASYPKVNAVEDYRPAAFQQQEHVDEDFRPYHYEHALNLGVDYTFPVGNGLNAVMEHFYIVLGSELLEKNADAAISAMSVNYPVGLLDRISAILYYSWKDESLYRFINVERSYDAWSFYLMAFWNPETFGIYNFNQEQTLFAGKGIQLMAVHNF